MNRWKGGEREAGCCYLDFVSTPSLYILILPKALIQPSDVSRSRVVSTQDPALVAFSILNKVERRPEPPLPSVRHVLVPQKYSRQVGQMAGFHLECNVMPSRLRQSPGNP